MEFKKITIAANMEENSRKRLESMHTLSTNMKELSDKVQDIIDRIEFTMMQNPELNSDKSQALELILIDLNNMFYALSIQYAFITQSALSELIVNRLSQYEDVENSDLDSIKLMKMVYDETVKFIFSKNIDDKLIELENILKHDIISKEDFLKFKYNSGIKNEKNYKEPEEVVKDFMIKKSTNSDIKN